MHSDLRAQAAFRLTGLRADAGIVARLRPALAARVRDLAALRHPFPVVLVTKGGEMFARPLTEIIDELVDDKTPRTRLLRIEREIRGLVSRGVEGTLGELWPADVKRPALDGEVVGCDVRFPRRFVAHAWERVHARKAERLRGEVEGLVFRLRQVLAADEARSAHGVSAPRLAETFGRGGEAFDVVALSRVLSRAGGASTLGDERRRRIGLLIATLENARLFTSGDAEPFTFDRCAPALRAFRARETEMREFVAARALAELEVTGAYDQALHGPLFWQLHENALPDEELERLPSYLVTLNWQELDADERAGVEELLCAGIPAKILVQFDDLLDDQGIGSHAHALSGAALGLGDVSVLQAPASLLPAMAEPLARALVGAGTALVSVFSGATASATLPPYLNAAAALESRAFPAIAYDPLAPDDGIDLFGNPQPETDWPAHELEFEDATLQRARRKVSFTPADFVAADTRFAAHFLPLDTIGSEEGASAASVLVVDDLDRLQELLVDEQVAIQARRCANRWRHLKRLAADFVPVVAAPPQPQPVEEKKEAAPPPVEVPAAPKAASSDDPYIETPRCTTCNECTQLNPRMFAYDANKQAYIADATAGTYRELVEAAEACQVSIIHPGKPRNPNEPELEELLSRAEAFS
jgi:hypothetical protein